MPFRGDGGVKLRRQSSRLPPEMAVAKENYKDPERFSKAITVSVNVTDSRKCLKSCQ